MHCWAPGNAGVSVCRGCCLLPGQAALPRVTPHYAVKCNPEPALIRLLLALGAGFDCASKVRVGCVFSCFCLGGGGLEVGWGQAGVSEGVAVQKMKSSSYAPCHCLLVQVLAHMASWPPWCMPTTAALAPQPELNGRS